MVTPWSSGRGEPGFRQLIPCTAKCPSDVDHKMPRVPVNGHILNELVGDVVGQDNSPR